MVTAPQGWLGFSLFSPFKRYRTGYTIGDLERFKWHLTHMIIHFINARARVGRSGRRKKWSTSKVYNKGWLVIYDGSVIIIFNRVFTKGRVKVILRVWRHCLYISQQCQAKNKEIINTHQEESQTNCLKLKWSKLRKVKKVTIARKKSFQCGQYIYTRTNIIKITLFHLF